MSLWFPPQPSVLCCPQRRWRVTCAPISVLTKELRSSGLRAASIPSQGKPRNPRNGRVHHSSSWKNIKADVKCFAVVDEFLTFSRHLVEQPFWIQVSWMRLPDRRWSCARSPVVLPFFKIYIFLVVFQGGTNRQAFSGSLESDELALEALHAHDGDADRARFTALARMGSGQGSWSVRKLVQLA